MYVVSIAVVPCSSAAGGVVFKVCAIPVSSVRQPRRQGAAIPCIAGRRFHAGAFGVLGAGAAAIGAVLLFLASRAQPPVAATG